MQWTIKKRLSTLTISGLVCVAAVSATGYWGITSVEKATTQVSTTGLAIRNHIEAGTYNDMTREDISAIFTKRGQEQQDNVDNLALHSKLLAQRLATAREWVVDPAIQSALDEEGRVVQQYLSAADSLSKATVRDASTADSGQCVQLYRAVQGKIEDIGDQLEQSAKGAVAKCNQAGQVFHARHVCRVWIFADASTGDGHPRHAQYHSPVRLILHQVQGHGRSQ